MARYCRRWAVRFPRCLSPRWPEAQCDVTVIPGRQRGRRAPGPRATECAKGSQPVNTHALSDTLFLAPRGLCNGRETSKTLTLCSPLDSTLFRLQLTRARAHRPSPNSPGEVGNTPPCEPRAGPGCSVLASSPAAPEEARGERGGEGGENTKEEPRGKWGSQARGEKKEGEES